MTYLTATFELFTLSEWVLVTLMFVWSGFVRSGLGFGGAALGLPVMLLLRPDPVFWLPVIAIHLLFFTFITVIRRMSNVDWLYLWQSMQIMIIPKLIGVFGLIILPPKIMVVIVYAIILFYAISYILKFVLIAKGKWAERLTLILGGYVSGTSLIGAPLIVTVYSQHVAKHQLRDTLFVLWFILVCIKVAAFIALDVSLQLPLALVLLPAAGIGHFIGLRAHQKLISGDDAQFKRYLGIGMAAVALIGFYENFA